MLISAYGINIDTDKPTTGVIANSDVPGIWDEMDRHCIDLAWEEYCQVRDARLAEIGNQLETLDAQLIGVDDAEHDRLQEENAPQREALEDEQKKLENDEGTDDISPSDERGTCLLGDWKKDPQDGKYAPDKTGSCGYAAIVGEIYSQIVWSKWVRRNRHHCSPCYPGQVDLDTEGKCIGYDYPPDMYEGDGADEPKPEIEEWHEPESDRPNQ